MTRDQETSHLHMRQAKRNIAVGWILAAFVVVVFAVTVVKLADGQAMQAFDHSLRPSLLESAQ